MIITRENIDNVPEEERLLLNVLLDDLEAINAEGAHEMCIDRQDFHNEYSAERTDPCPDFYGYYTLRDKNGTSGVIGDFMTLEGLDSALFLLNEYITFQKNGFVE